MLRVYACIAQDHDLRLVAAAAFICALAAFTAMSLRLRAAEADRTGTRLRWLTLAAIVTGSGVWSTHFVAMLAFKPSLPIGYDIGLTAASVAIAILVTWGGLAIALYRPRFAALGGAIVGGAVGAMHFVGMSAMRVQAVVSWDAGYVIASLFIGISMGAAALHFATRAADWRGRALGAALLALGICGLHFTAMAAASLEIDPFIPFPRVMIEPGALAVAIGALTILIVALGLAGSMVDRHLAGRAAAEARRLRQHVAELETMRRELEANVVKTAAALEAAEAGNRAKSQFLASMSHELRTPLNAVIGFADLLGKEPFGALGSPRYRDYITHIRNSGTHLLHLINDVLEFSKSESGALALDEGPVDLRQEIAAALASLAPLGVKGGLTLYDDAAVKVPLLRADARRVRQILLNILSNAIKFTPPGGAVRARAFRREDGLAVLVSDTGIGIAPEDVPTAFERFGQIDSRLSRRYEGTGLGLPLTKQLVELHGGTVQLSSVVGKGTTVLVVFPLERVMDGDAILEAKAA